MRNRWWLLALSLLLTLLLLPATALAGGGGIIRRVKPLDRAKAGEVPIYVQALQHGVTPRSDHAVTVRAEGPGGAPAEAAGKIDPSLGFDSVYVATLSLRQPGTWHLTVSVKGEIRFPDETFTMEITPGATAAVQSADSAPAVAGPTGAAFPWPLAAGALLAGLATVGILVLWRR